MTDAGQKIREQYADTRGFTDHVLAVTALPGFQFIPRIRDLQSRRLYLFDPAACPKGLIGGKIKEPLITANWPDILRTAATMATGVMPPSQLLRKFAPTPDSKNWRWPCAKSNGWNGRSSSSNGCLMRTCSAVHRSV